MPENKGFAGNREPVFGGVAAVRWYARFEDCRVRATILHLWSNRYVKRRPAIKLNFVLRLMLVALGVVATLAVVAFGIVLLTREQPAPIEPVAKTAVKEEEKDPFEQLAVLITPQELAVKARAKKKSPDPYIPATSYPEKQNRRIIDRAKALQGEAKACFDGFIKQYQDTLYHHCLENDLAGDAEDGCRKSAYQFSIHTRVVEEALKSCKIKY